MYIGHDRKQTVASGVTVRLRGSYAEGRGSILGSFLFSLTLCIFRLKSGSICLCVPVCAHDAVSSKLGRDAHTQTTWLVSVVPYVVSILFLRVVSSVTKISYSVVSPNPSMNCPL